MLRCRKLMLKLKKFQSERTAVTIVTRAGSSFLQAEFPFGGGSLFIKTAGWWRSWNAWRWFLLTLSSVTVFSRKKTSQFVTLKFKFMFNLAGLTTQSFSIENSETVTLEVCKFSARKLTVVTLWIWIFTQFLTN